MKELRQRIPSVNMAYYISMQTIESVHTSLGIPLGRGIGADSPKNGFANGDIIEDGEFVEEDVPDEVSDDELVDDFI